MTHVTRTLSGRTSVGVDLTRVSFPSDRLTVKLMRELYPKHFDEHSPPSFFVEKDGRLADETVGRMLAIERTLARAGFNSPGDVGPNRPLSSITSRPFSASDVLLDAARQLAAMYVQYKIASGARHAEELIQSILRQGAEQSSRGQINNLERQKTLSLPFLGFRE